ncbi:MAG: rhodanese-related sulfurtransferase [Patescibacteria group bacterium]
MKYQILLYYKYVAVSDAEAVRKEQRELCERLNLKGRIIVATEGINGTLEGLVSDTEAYIHAMEESGYFKGINYKKSQGTGQAFPKLSVKIRPEVVTTGVSGLDPTQTTGKYLSADELHVWYEEGKEFYVVDMRNDYEYASGHFEGFVPSGLANFHDLKQVLPKIQHLKSKTIVTVCTGGIRCEKASGFLLQNGFSDVYQLKDGIQTYMEAYPNEHFKGKLYVFDNRLTLGFNVNDSKHEIVGKCDHCSKSCDSYVNCAYNECHRHYISCSECLDKETGYAFCNQECKENYFKITIHHRAQRGLHPAELGHKRVIPAL